MLDAPILDMIDNGTQQYTAITTKLEELVISTNASYQQLSKDISTNNCTSTMSWEEALLVNSVGILFPPVQLCLPPPPQATTGSEPPMALLLCVCTVI